MSFETTTPRGAYERMQRGSIYLDVRSAEEFAEGHPKGAVNIPVFFLTPVGRERNAAFVEEVQKQFAK